MIIAQISDTHLTLDATDSVQRISDFQAVIDDINRLDPAPDLIVHTGDVVHNGLADEYARAAQILKGACAPVYVIAGNKDNRANLRAAFSANGYLSETSDFIDYSIEEYPVRLLMIDTVNPHSAKGDFCDQRFARLEDHIARDRSRPIAVFAHHPPFEVLVGPERFHFGDPGTMGRLAAVLNDSGRVISLFNGHVHRPTFGMVGTIPAVVMPCVATAVRYGDYPAHMATRPIYFVHRYDARYGFSTESHVTQTSVA